MIARRILALAAVPALALGLAAGCHESNAFTLCSEWVNPPNLSGEVLYDAKYLNDVTVYCTIVKPGEYCRSVTLNPLAADHHPVHGVCSGV